MKNRLTGYETLQTRRGFVSQSGIRSSVTPHNVWSTEGWITRAVVLNVYYPDEDQRTPVTESAQRMVTADVRTYGRYSRVLPRVPVLQWRQGLHDSEWWIPRPSRQNTTGGSLNDRRSASSTPTPADFVDGDHVLVGFLENDSAQPVILPFTHGHPQAATVPQSGGATRRIQHHGTAFVIDAEGSATLDARDAHREAFGANGAPVSASGSGGAITLRTKDGASRETSIQLGSDGNITLSRAPGSATEPVVLGTTHTNWLSRLLDQLLALTVNTWTGPSTTPINAPAIAALKAELLTNAHLSDFIFVAKGP